MSSGKVTSQLINCLFIKRRTSPDFSFADENITFVDLEVDEKKVKLAIERCELSRLMKQEDKNGFKEASEKAKRFFGAKYEERLTQEQKERIEEECGEMMRTFKYLEEEKAA